jgi:hypothetical protein
VGSFRCVPTAAQCVDDTLHVGKYIEDSNYANYDQVIKSTNEKAEKSAAY